MPTTNQRISMPATPKQLDLSPLPATARQEIRDFYDFLLTRYQTGRKPVSRKLPEAFATPIKVEEYLKLSRNEIYDEV